LGLESVHTGMVAVVVVAVVGGDGVIRIMLVLDACDYSW